MDRQQIMKELEEITLDINLFMRHEFSNEFNSNLAKNLICLTPNQQMVLFLVGNKGIKHVKDLAEKMGITTSAVSQIVGKLENHDILKREIEPHNRRSTLIELGPKGMKLIEVMEKVKSTIFHHYLSKMEENDLLMIKNSFEKFYTILKDSKER